MSDDQDEATPPAPDAPTGFNWGLRAGVPVFPDSGAEVVPPPTLIPPSLPGPTPPLIPPPGPYRADPPTEPYATVPYVDQPTEQYTVQPWAPAGTAGAPVALPQQPLEPASPLDALFGEHQFQEYEELGVIGSIQVPPTTGNPQSGREPRPPLSTRAKTLLSIGGGLVAAIVIIALFFLGVRLGAAPTAVPSPAASAHPSATPTSASEGGPAAPGVRAWTALQGGECIQPFTSAWAETFTVVPCANDHDAEMVFKGKLPDSSAVPYPTSSQFQTTLTALCRASSAINYAAAASITDLQISFSYPPDASSWNSGDRTYYCFVNRQSGSNLPGDLAVSKTP